MQTHKTLPVKDSTLESFEVKACGFIETSTNNYDLLYIECSYPIKVSLETLF